MRRALAILGVLGAMAAAVVFTGASDDGGSRRYLLEFDNAFGLVEGGDLKVGGVRAGRTTGFKVNEEADRPTALVEVEITEPGFSDFRKDASCRVRPQSLIGEYFVDCQPGSDRRRIPAGGIVPVGQNEGTINADLVNNVLRRPYRERFRLILAELGTGLAGRPQDLNAVIRRAHPGLLETSKTLRILTRQNQVIEDFIRDSDTVLVDLEERKKDVARWVEEAGQTSEISATRREALARQFRRFPTFLDELKPTMVELGKLSDEQIPTLRDLRRAAPQLTTFFEELGPFARESLPSIRSLGRASRTGREALRQSANEIDELRQLAEDAPRFAQPLSEFLLSIDDRERWAYDPDRRAAESAPPAPDPTSDAAGKGFTGMESILLYPYWQGLSINQFDEIGHLLRVVAFESECGGYHTGAGIRYGERQDPAVQELFHECATWVGPYQPGITAPDPTAGGSATAARARADREQAQRTGRVDNPVRGPGEPEAPAVPGQRDPSVPNIVLPPSVQELIDSLPDIVSGRGGSAPGSSADPTRLLDFLLSP